MSSKEYSRRLLHGRGRTFLGFEQVTIDRYPPALFVALYRSVEEAFLEKLLATINLDSAVNRVAVNSIIEINKNARHQLFIQ